MTVAKAQNIELMPLDQLRPYDRNARLHTQQQIQQMQQMQMQRVQHMHVIQQVQRHCSDKCSRCSNTIT